MVVTAHHGESIVCCLTKRHSYRSPSEALFPTMRQLSVHVMALHKYVSASTGLKEACDLQSCARGRVRHVMSGLSGI